MQEIFKNTKVKWVERILAGTLSYIASCAFSSKLLVLDVILHPQITKWLLGNIAGITLLALIAFIVVSVYAEQKSKVSITANVYNNICKNIFDQFVKPLPSSNHLVKVSLFKAQGVDSENPTLKCVGRYQTKMPIKRCKTSFKAGEGCVGLAYQLGQNIRLQIEEFNVRQPTNYYRESLNAFKLPEKAAKKLNDKACEFLCIPIRFFGEDIPWGVISIDSMKKDVLKNIPEADIRTVEMHMDCYSVLMLL